MSKASKRYKEMQEPQGSRKKKKKPSRSKKTQRPQRAKKTKSSSWEKILIPLCVLGFIVSLYLMVRPKGTTNFALPSLSSIQIGLPKIFAQDKVNAKDPNLYNQKEGAGGDEGEEQDGSSDLLGSVSAKVSMENTSLNETLENKRKELEKKERDLNLLSEELEARKTEIDKQLKDIFAMRRKISSTLDSKVEADSESLLKLVDVYSNMKPQPAARVIVGLNEELAVRVLGKMKKQNAAAILNYIDAKKARTLSEKYAGVR